jgi:hypothetical protein
MIVRRDITCGEHAVETRAARLVDDDAVLDVDTTRLGHLDVGIDAKTNHNHRAGQNASRLGDDLFDAVGSPERRDLLLRHELHTVRAVDLGDPRRGRISEDTRERTGPREDGRHVGTELPQRRRDLRADEAHADDDGLRPTERALPDGVCIGLRAKRKHAVETDAGQPRCPGARAGRDDDRVGRDLASVVEHDATVGGVDAARGTGESQHDVRFAVPVRRLDERCSEILFAAQVRLR